jgi:alkanesulfonate monooxygenase SsuD/methylene tetrahydromethanopterin reductase-like flavin-dependent oxidoreductase (luciferase family)
VKKTTLLIGGAIGYVLGTRAGRERYEQIKQTAGKVRRNPTVQSVVDDARSEAKAAAQQASDKVTDTVRKASGSEGSADGFDDDVPPMGSTS